MDEKNQLNVVSMTKKREEKKPSSRSVIWHNRIKQLLESGKTFKEISEVLIAEGIGSPAGVEVTAELVSGTVRKLEGKGIVPFGLGRVNSSPQRELLDGGKLWTYILHAKELDDTTRVKLLRVLTEASTKKGL